VELTPQNSQPPRSEPERTGGSITQLAVVFYALIFAAAWLWTALTSSSLFYATEAARAHGPTPLRDVLVGVLAGLVTVHLSRVFTRRTRSGEAMARGLGAALGPLSVSQCVVLAFVSGIAEEALFRGALQPKVGLVAASVLFGLAHFVPRREFAVWTGTTILAGFMLGLLFQETGNLIAPIVAHFVVNALNLRWLSVNYGYPAAEQDCMSGN